MTQLTNTSLFFGFLKNTAAISLLTHKLCITRPSVSCQCDRLKHILWMVHIVRTPVCCAIKYTAPRGTFCIGNGCVVTFARQSPLHFLYKPRQCRSILLRSLAAIAIFPPSSSVQFRPASFYSNLNFQPSYPICTFPNG